MLVGASSVVLTSTANFPLTNGKLRIGSHQFALDTRTNTIRFIHVGSMEQQLLNTTMAQL